MTNWKIISEVDAVDNPVLITPYFITHLNNSAIIFYLIFIVFYYAFNIFKNTCNTFDQNKVNSKTKKLILIFYVLLFTIFTLGKTGFKNYSEFIDGLNYYILFGICVVTALFFNFLYKFIIPKYKDNDLIFALSVLATYLVFVIHTYYEYMTTGKDKKDDWWSDGGDNVTNSYLNSVGDTIASLIGCYIVYKILNKYGVSLKSLIYTILLWVACLLLFYGLKSAGVTMGNVKNDGINNRLKSFPII